MLVLSRRQGEKIHVGDAVIVGKPGCRHRRLPGRLSYQPIDIPCRNLSVAAFFFTPPLFWNDHVRRD